MTYDWDDILIVGDSFCRDRYDKNHWPQVLTSSLTNKKIDPACPPRGKGFAGASWWSARKCLLEELEKKTPKVLIFCYTEPFRVPNDQDLGINTKSVLLDRIFVPEGVNPPSENFKKAAKGYYEHLISEDFHQWSFIQFLDEVDNLIEKHNIEKSIHLFCFRGPYLERTFKKGITMLFPLFEYQSALPLWRNRTENPNHFTPEQNIEFGVKLYSIIKNYPGDGVRLNTKLIGK